MKRALFIGVCANEDCTEPIQVGEEIVSLVEGKWAHAVCPEPRAVVICKTCHVQKPCFCD